MAQDAAEGVLGTAKDGSVKVFIVVLDAVVVLGVGRRPSSKAPGKDMRTNTSGKR